LAFFLFSWVKGFHKILVIFTMEGWFDGGSRGNPGVAGAGWVLYEGRRVVDCGTVYVGDNSTNNVSEYTGLVALMEAAARHGAERLVVRGDSKLAINQVNGVWRCNKDHLIPLRDRVVELKAEFGTCELMHVRRNENKVADALSNLAMDRRCTDTGIHLMQSITQVDKPPAKRPKLAAPQPDRALKRTPSEAPAGVTTRVRIRRKNGVVVQDCDRWTGRRWQRGGWDLPRDDFCNPISVKASGGAAEAVRRYKAYLCQTRPDLLRRILDGELDGLRLGCFCELDEPCHAQFLCDLANDKDYIRELLVCHLYSRV
jgi:ribonuclease HI